MSTATEANLTEILQAATHLVPAEKTETTAPASTSLEKLLEGRLQAYLREQGESSTEHKHEWNSLTDVELATATEALSIVERTDAILRSNEKISLGTRDWRMLRTLISLIFKWGTEPLLASACEVWVASPKDRKGGRVVEVDTKVKDYQLLSQFTTRAMSLLFPNGLKEAMSRTSIATGIAERHMVDLFRSSLTLGWLPKALSTPTLPVVDHLRPFTMRLLSTVSPALLIATLGSILSKKDQLPAYVGRTASSFLTQQLMRPGGVLGLCESMFGNEEASGEEVQLEKLESVSKMLMSVPAKMEPKEYYSAIIPRIIQLLSDKTPNSYRKMAAYTLSQVLRSDKNDASRATAVTIVYNTLHAPFTSPRSPPIQGPPSSGGSDSLKASVTLSRLLILIANCDPSPEVITNLLTPIVAPLYSLLFYLSTQKTSDPRYKESVQGLLATWGKIVGAETAVNTLWGIVLEGEMIHWKIDIEGNIDRIESAEKSQPLAFLLPKDRKQVDEEPDITANLFDFYPDPIHFVSFLKTLDRGDVVSDLFIKLLEAYRAQRMQGQDQDPMKALHHLQILMQMQMQLLTGTSSSILNKPDQLLSFIKQVLESTSASGSEAETAPSKSRHDGLHISQPLQEEEDADSDDDDPESEVIRPDDELLETTLNLLLAVMESREDLSVRTAPLLNDIFELLEPIALSGSSSLGPLAREGRMVITARSASTSVANQKASSGDKEYAQETYQKALKLLQDPILPVRAHGLLLLKELVTKDSKPINSALRPAILSIFLQSIQDEDSYIFLNGVQGLAAMVDVFGQEVLSSLLREYSDGLERNGTFMSEQALSIRVRVGEAVGIVIRRCGTSLGKYRDTLIPTLFNVFRLRTIPTILRTSALSLLADAIDTYPLVMLPYTDDLSQAMIDLLQVESEAATEPIKKKGAKETKGQDEKDGDKADGQAPEPSGDNDLLTANPKYPPLKRAALHLLGRLVRSTIREMDENETTIPFSAEFLRRARITLGYVAATDRDNVTRVMAREARDDIGSFESSLLGQDI